MDAPATELAILARSRHRQEAMDARLVLDAVGIPADAVFRDGWWLLVVAAEDQLRALEELRAYRAENPRGPKPRPVRVPVMVGAFPGVVIYALVLMVVAVAANRWLFGFDWIDAGVMRAGLVRSGEWWRTLTALTLHGDAGHLSANLAFGAVFGLFAAQALGGGVAWCGIVLAGALGNLLNALVQPAYHSSLGASTAVFAALGILVAHALRYRHAVAAGSGLIRRWSPLVGGVALLAYTGTGGERTDVVAHLTGFLAGLALGWVCSRLPYERLGSRSVQRTTGVIALGLLVLGWSFALLSH